MEEIREWMAKIEDPRHPSYVKYPLVDVLIIIMCAVLCGIDTLGDLGLVWKKSTCPTGGSFAPLDGAIFPWNPPGFLRKNCLPAAQNPSLLDTSPIFKQALVIYAENRKEFFRKELGIQDVPWAGIDSRKDKWDSGFSRNAYLFSHRGENQPSLLADVRLFFEDADNEIEWECFQTIEKHAGRIEKRVCRKGKDIFWLQEHKWPGLLSVFLLNAVLRCADNTA